jgi:hypothetical protein
VSTVRRALWATLLLCLSAAPAAAEWQLTPFLGYTFKGATTLNDLEDAVGTTHWHFGGAVTLLGDGPFGVEALFHYVPGFFQNPEEARIPVRVTSSRTYALMGNAVLTAPRRLTQYGLRPYLSGGVGRIHVFRNDLLDLAPIPRLNLLGMNLGGGGVGFLNDRLGLRFDLRYFRKIHGPDEESLEIPVTVGFEPIRLRYWTANVGVVIRP